MTNPNESKRPQNRRDRLGTWLFKVFGPATVQGAVTGNTPEAREHWKRRMEAVKREREEQRRTREAERNGG